MSLTRRFCNLIHINPYPSDFAPPPGTITHGTWSSAATRKYVETVVIDLEGKELWTPDELAVPVFHTENGACVACFGIWWVTAMCFVVLNSLFILYFHQGSNLLQGYYFARALALRLDVHTPPTLA